MYPCLLQNGYGLGFFPEDGVKGQKKGFDSRISATIEAINIDFLNCFDDEVFILYHCEASDGKQACRYKLFEKWYAASIFKSKTYKHGLEVEIKISDTETVTHYIGFITPNSNKNIESAIIELEKFSIDLINENINKAIN